MARSIFIGDVHSCAAELAELLSAVAVTDSDRVFFVGDLLTRGPDARGVLFELPDVIGALDVEHARLTPQAGDFFVDPLPAADLYVLMEIIHDWPDAECLSILSAVRRTAAPGATVLVIETILHDDRPDPRGRMLDVIMLAISGGRERTARELDELFQSAGFGKTTLIETTGALRMVETTAV